jgi:hypothetical protein
MLKGVTLQRRRFKSPTGSLKGPSPNRAMRGCPAKPTTPQGPDQVNALLLFGSDRQSDQSSLAARTTGIFQIETVVEGDYHGAA